MLGAGAAAAILPTAISAAKSPQRVVIGHSCCLDDPTAGIIKQIAKRGAYVGFDRVTGGRVTDPKKVVMIQAFLDAGYMDKLLICSDFTGRRSPARPGYGNTLTVFLPLLRQSGIQEKTLHSIMYDNPRRFLAFVPRKLA
jgi:predicted metal-dependent phosphotriesterase family hydrolase